MPEKPSIHAVQSVCAALHVTLWGRSLHVATQKFVARKQVDNLVRKASSSAWGDDENWRLERMFGPKKMLVAFTSKSWWKADLKFQVHLTLKHIKLKEAAAGCTIEDSKQFPSNSGSSYQKWRCFTIELVEWLVADWCILMHMMVWRGLARWMAFAVGLSAQYHVIVVEFWSFQLCQSTTSIINPWTQWTLFPKKYDDGRSIEIHDYGSSYVPMCSNLNWNSDYKTCMVSRNHQLYHCGVLASMCFRYLASCNSCPFRAHDSCRQASQHVAQLHGREHGRPALAGIPFE